MCSTDETKEKWVRKENKNTFELLKWTWKPWSGLEKEEWEEKVEDEDLYIRSGVQWVFESWALRPGVASRGEDGGCDKTSSKCIFAEGDEME